MKTMLVMSDTHGNKGAVARLKEIAGETDYIVHLGDHSRDIEPIRAQYPERVFSVDGNCDLAFRTERTLEIEGVKVLLTHGHRFGVKSGLERLFYFCGERGIDLPAFRFSPNSADFTIFYFILPITLPVGMIFASIYYYKSHIEEYMANVH